MQVTCVTYSYFRPIGTGVAAASGGCYEASVKLAPANQTFIPASNPVSRRFAVSSPDDAGAQLGQALRTAVSGAQLKSVTIVASRPDDNVVVVQAQYAPDLDFPPAGLAAARTLISRQPGSSRGSSYLSPIEQSARTQSGELRSAPLLDVRA
jgi:hypothetical protein